MEIGDVREVGELLRRYLARFDIEQEFKTDREVEHWFLSGKGKGKGKGGSEVDEEVDEDGGKAGRVVWAYVVEVSDLGWLRWWGKRYRIWNLTFGIRHKGYGT